MPALRLLPPASCRRAFSHLERDSALSPPTPTLPAALSSWGSHFGLSPQGSSLPALKTSCASGALVFLTCKLCDLRQVTGSLWALVSLFIFKIRLTTFAPPDSASSTSTLLWSWTQTHLAAFPGPLSSMGGAVREGGREGAAGGLFLAPSSPRAMSVTEGQPRDGSSCHCGCPVGASPFPHGSERHWKQGLCLDGSPEPSANSVSTS